MREDDSQVLWREISHRAELLKNHLDLVLEKDRKNHILDCVMKVSKQCFGTIKSVCLSLSHISYIYI